MKVRILSAGIGIFLTFLILLFYETLVLNFSVSAICSIMVYEIFRMTKIYDKSVFSFIVSEIYAFVFPFLSISEILELINSNGNVKKLVLLKGQNFQQEIDKIPNYVVKKHQIKIIESINQGGVVMIIHCTKKNLI